MTETNQAPAIPSGAYSKNTFSFNEVVLFDRGETEEVLMSLREQIDRYGMVSVADFYDMVGQSAPYTANKYGWRDLRDAGIDRVRDGYSINFPKSITIRIIKIKKGETIMNKLSVLFNKAWFLD